LQPFDAGISGLRSFAADYSGKASVPALFVVVDKIVGGKKKVWVFQLPKNFKEDDNKSGAELQIGDNAFTITQGDASLKATFISPSDVKIEIPPVPYKAHLASKTDDARIPALHVTGRDPQSGDFFVVMTQQKGSAPIIEVKGKGLSSVVTVGEQTVRFDGQKIILGP